MIVTTLYVRGKGWTVFDVDNRRRLAGPFPTWRGRALAIAIDLDVRKLRANDEAGIKAVVEKHTKKIQKKGAPT